MRIFPLFQLPDIVDLELGVLSVIVNGAYYPVFSALFPLKLLVLFDEGILGTLVQQDAVPPIDINYRITKDETQFH